jgi:putative ABC transport system permease protein
VKRWFYKLPLRVRSLLRKRHVEHELSDELRFHLDHLIAANRAQGMTPEEARFAALRELGGLEQIKEECRDMRRVNYLEHLFQDLHYGARMLWKSPGLTAILAITIGLGIGVNTAVFSLVNGFLLRPLPVTSPEQITVLAIHQKGAPVGSSGFSYPEFVDFRAQADVFSSLFATVLSNVELNAHDRSDQCLANYVSAGFFSTLGIKPAAGRFLLPSEGEVHGEPVLVVLGNAYWQRRFGGDPGVIGEPIQVDGKPATVIGVAPRSFHGMFSIFAVEVYLPFSALTLEESPNILWNNRDFRRMLVFGRLKPGVSLAHAQSSVDVIVHRLAQQYPATDKWMAVRLVPEKRSRPIPYANGFFVATSGLFLLLAGLVLLLACTNVENILLALGAARQREMVVRSALGAGRGRLVRQTLTESLLLALVGGSAGLFLGFWASRMLGAIRVQNLPIHLGFDFDWRVFAYALASALCTGIVVGLLPALRTRFADAGSVLHGGGQGSSPTAGIPRLRDFLIVAQVAGSLALLVVAGLFVRSLESVRSFDLGFDPDHLLNVTLDPSRSGYDQARAAEFYRQLESRIRSLPGVQSASLASHVPMGGFPSGAQVSIQNHPLPPGQPPRRVLFNRVDSTYFATLRIALLRGRSFTESDSSTSPGVAIINHTMAAAFWPHEDAMGKRFSVTGPGGPFMEVVGIAKDGKYNVVSEDPQPYFYVPLTQSFAFRCTLQIRTAVPPDSLAPTVKNAIQQLAPGLSIIDLRTMQESLNGALGFFIFRMAAGFASVIGMIGLILAVVGVYGVVSFAVVQRTHEIGVRMALGANDLDIVALVWRRGVRLVLAGVVIGLVAALGLAHAMRHLVVGVAATDPATFIAVSLALTCAALVACYLPARRAMKVDPMVALRYE